MNEFESTEDGSWNTNLAEHSAFSIFCDEFTEIADLANKLPYGVLALIAAALEDIKRGTEQDIDPSDWHMYEKMYYFIAGIMLIKPEKKLSFTDADLLVMGEIFEYMGVKISLVEGYLAGYLEAKYDNNEGSWAYKVPVDYKEQLSQILESNGQNDQKED